MFKISPENLENINIKNLTPIRRPAVRCLPPETEFTSKKSQDFVTSSPKNVKHYSIYNLKSDKEYLLMKNEKREKMDKNQYGLTTAITTRKTVSKKRVKTSKNITYSCRPYSASPGKNSSNRYVRTQTVLSIWSICLHFVLSTT